MEEVSLHSVEKASQSLRPQAQIKCKAFLPMTCASAKILLGSQTCERKRVRCGEPQPFQTRAQRSGSRLRDYQHFTGAFYSSRPVSPGKRLFQYADPRGEIFRRWLVQGALIDRGVVRRGICHPAQRLFRPEVILAAQIIIDAQAVREQPVQPVAAFRVAALRSLEHFPAPRERLCVFRLGLLRGTLDMGVHLGPERR